MEIIITKNKKVYSSGDSWVYSERRWNAKKRTYHWKDRWYYPSLEACYWDLLDSLIAEGDRQALRERFRYVVEQLEVLRKGFFPDENGGVLTRVSGGVKIKYGKGKKVGKKR